MSNLLAWISKTTTIDKIMKRWRNKLLASQRTKSKEKRCSENKIGISKLQMQEFKMVAQDPSWNKKKNISKWYKDSLGVYTNKY